MSTVQQPIVAPTYNANIDPQTVSSNSLDFELNQSIAVKDFTNVAIVPLSPPAANITYTSFVSSISYAPYPYNVKSTSTTSLLSIDKNLGNKINLRGYNQIDLNVNSAIATLKASTDYTLEKNITSNGQTLIPTLSQLPSDLFEFEMVQNGSFVYLVGGYNGISVSTSTSTTPSVVTKTPNAVCYYSYINSNGIMGEFTATSALPVALARGYLTVVGSYLYYFGGENSSGDVVDTIYYAAINSDGSLGSWNTSAQTLPVAGSHVVGVTYNNTIYILNLYPGPKSTTSAPLTSIDYYSTTQSSTGDLNALADGGISLFGDGFYYGGETIVLGTTVYVLGGMDYNGGYHADIYSIAISQTQTLAAATNINNPLPAVLFDFNIVRINNPFIQYDDRLYIFGAYQQNGLGGYTLPLPFSDTTGTPTATTLTPTEYSSPILYTARIASDTIGPWTISDVTVPSYCRGGALLTNNKVYSFGGINITQNQNVSNTGNSTPYIYSALNTVYNAELLMNRLQPFNGPQTLNTGLAQYGMIQIGNLMYAIGGYNNNVGSTNIYHAEIQDDDTLGSWVLSSNPLPAAIWGFAMVQIQNTLYLIGGFDGTEPVNSIYSATINSNNTLTPFLLVGTIPVALSNPGVYVGNSTIYLIGGLGTSAITGNIYTAPIDSSGNIGSWVKSSNVLPLGMRNISTLVTPDNTLYVFGNTTTVPANNVAYAIPINSDGSLGSVNTTAQKLPATSSQYMTTNLINGTVYLVGNNNSDNSQFDIFTTTSTGGVLGTWTTLPTNLPLTTISQSVFNIGNMLYVMGVTDSNTYYPNIYSFIMDFDYSYSLKLNSALAAIPTNIYLTQFVYGSGILASGGYLQKLTVETQTFSAGIYTYNYNTLYNTNNGDTVYLQFNNMNKGDLINAFRGTIYGQEVIQESQATQ